MPKCFFATDIHGRIDRYEKLLSLVLHERPAAVFLGGDLLPSWHMSVRNPGQPYRNFVKEYLSPHFANLRQQLREAYPAVLLILGNDDPRCEERFLMEGEAQGLWQYLHARKVVFERFHVYGLAYVPPTPFLLKDWERYDVSRYIPPGSVSPEEGHRTMPMTENEIKWSTIENELASLTGDEDLEKAIFLLHSSPYDTLLDRAALDALTYEHVPVDVHIGSIALRRFIEKRQPLLTLHGHIHESTRLTGEWKIRMGRTICINGAHDGPELALIRFYPESPSDATRELV